ncbi:HTH-type transcriptional regulator / antitoxin MqsA [Methylobacterium sp. 174MFSha1.1]|uniref:type II TA system antitoxin MqsA family protein n=1 Tax=Methylobacterium sp. 174MFSha1.1 TaxID=1502749 RepID=UPI0008E9558F|nr:type II TA system antitoxin MqsA family protein [Methylobacterium sp. 174MFSha1.1]SFV09421.1 HTH-type transcriptional regulator / antitoxin MqsA [Methylobacterium sp. 174MFSha1.1]
MMRGEKKLSIEIDGQTFSYMQPGWWCSLTDPDDEEGQLVDEDNQIAELAERTARMLARGETLFVPVVFRALRERLGLSQREAGLLFGTGEKSFEKYESGEISPSEPTKRLLRLAIQHPDLFEKPKRGGSMSSSVSDATLIHTALRAVEVDRFYEGLFASTLASPSH